MKAFDYALAKNEDGVHKALAKGYHIKASGIDLLDMLKERMEKSEQFVSILPVENLRGIRETEQGISIGALVTLQEMGDSPLLRSKFPALAYASGEAATPQVRARATVAGNLLQRPRCWYFRSKEFNCLKKGGGTCFAWDGENTYHAFMGEGPCRIVHPSNTAPVFVAANATIAASDGKEERRIAAGDFFTSPMQNIYRENVLKDDELVTEIILESLPEKSGYVEFREKQSFDWPLASCTAVLIGGKWSVVLGHVSQIPWRATATEKILEGKADIDGELAETAADAAMEGASPMSQNAFRLKIARAAVRRALLRACGKDEV